MVRPYDFVAPLTLIICTNMRKAIHPVTYQKGTEICPKLKYSYPAPTYILHLKNWEGYLKYQNIFSLRTIKLFWSSWKTLPQRNIYSYTHLESSWGLKSLDCLKTNQKLWSCTELYLPVDVKSSWLFLSLYLGNPMSQTLDISIYLFC